MSTPPVSDELFEAVDAVRQTHGVRNHFDRETQRTVFECGCGLHSAVLGRGQLLACAEPEDSTTITAIVAMTAAPGRRKAP